MARADCGIVWRIRGTGIPSIDAVGPLHKAVAKREACRIKFLRLEGGPRAAYTSPQILTSGLFLPLRRLLRLEKCALSAGNNVVLPAESLGVGAQMIVGSEFSAGRV
jgi:hypothetical protein